MLPMHRRIPLSQLTVGMYVIGLDQSWLKTPFLRHRMRITTTAQIEAMKACGVQYVVISADKEERSESLAVPPPPGEPERPTDGQAPGAMPSAASFEDELPVAVEAYRAAKHVIQEALQDVRMGREINTDAVARAVERMADSVLRNSDALASLSRVKSYDEYTFFHSVNTAILALALGRSLGMERDMLHQLGMGALLHDVGKMKIPLQILNKPGRLEPHEYEVMKLHAVLGAEVLSHKTGLRDEVIRPALEHHERSDGSGYNFGKNGDQLSRLSMVTSVVDIYDAVTSDRVYQIAWTPHEALRLLYAQARSGKLDLPLVERFIRCIGIYPVGSCVKLTTGEIAIVTQIRQTQPFAPVLIPVRGPDGRPISRLQEIDLAVQANDPERRIAEALDPSAIGINPNDYIPSVRAC